MFSEKERWKKKRKLFTHVFNYNYLKKKQKKLSEIASEKLAEFSKDQS